jgi:DNA-binding response OmpR family regulator
MEPRKTILVIEDDPNQQHVYEIALRRAGYNVVARGEADAGLQWLGQILPDLIVLDIMLPGISGIEMLQQIRSSPNGKHVPVLIVTAKADISYEDFAEYNITNFLRKPLLPATLIEAIEAAIS